MLYWLIIMIEDNDGIIILATMQMHFYEECIVCVSIIHSALAD